MTDGVVCVVRKSTCPTQLLPYVPSALTFTTPVQCVYGFYDPKKKSSPKVTGFSLYEIFRVLWSQIDCAESNFENDYSSGAHFIVA
jgi:hypothetical protein